MPLASKLPAQEQAQHSQILSLSLSGHLGNGNLYLQTVGAGGEHEILKSTPPPFSLACLPSHFLRPLSHFSSVKCIAKQLASGEALLCLTFPCLQQV